MRRCKLLVALALAMAMAGCLKIAVKSPDGTSSASYTGTSIVGGEGVSCGTTQGVTSCQGTGQDLSGLAQAILPYLAQYGALAAAVPAPSSTPTPSIANNLSTPAR